MKPVAITAIGVASAAGLGVEPAVSAICKGQSLVRIEHRPGWRELGGGALAVVQEVLEDIPDFIDDRKVALLAAALRSEPALLEKRGERCGVWVGTGLSSVTPYELEQDIYPHRIENRLSAEKLLSDLMIRSGSPQRHFPNRATAWLSEQVGGNGPQITSFSACAASAEALAAAARSVACGEVDTAFAAGLDAMLHPMGLVSFQVLGALSSGVSRPFDRHRDGFVLGEGAAILRLEREPSGPVLGWILGCGASCDAFGVTAPPPNGHGAEMAMRRALVDAALDSDAIEWVKAHATGTPVGDAAEMAAIERVFGDKIKVSSIKGSFGHTLAASGAVELGICLMALRAGTIPGTIGCIHPDASLDIVLEPRKQRVNRWIANSFGFGGQNVSIVVQTGQAEA